MTEGCFAHLQQHAVLLNETTIRQIRDPATALDLYIWLAYRLRRLDPKCPVALSWQQFATHFGNEGPRGQDNRGPGTRPNGTGCDIFSVRQNDAITRTSLHSAHRDRPLLRCCERLSDLVYL